MTDTTEPLGFRLDADSLTAELDRQLMALLSHTGPIRYDDAGIAVVEEAARTVWDAMDPLTKDRLALESARRVAELFGSSEGSPA